MFQLRHIGIYVRDLKKIEDFYCNVFNMNVICHEIVQSDELIHDFLQDPNGSVKISKLITEYGKVVGSGDMVELLEVTSKGDQYNPFRLKLYCPGATHLGFFVAGIEETVDRILHLGGMQLTTIHLMPNKKRCCFCRDIEGNGLELIE